MVILRIAAWGVVLGLAGLALSQIVNRGSHLPPIYIGQALSPYLFGAMVPLALVALARRDITLGLAAALVSMPLLVLGGPLVRPQGLPAPASDAPRLTVLSANVLWRNPQMDEAVRTILAEDPDVIVISELTDEFDEALVEGGILERYPYRAGSPENWSRGTGVWSRLPIVSAEVLPIFGRTTVEAVIDVDGTHIRVIGAHPSQPIDPVGRTTWRVALRQISEIAMEPEAPLTLVVGDLNASWWHPPYRGMIDAGLVDVHNALGDGLSRSWPSDRTFIPPFVRIDHALVRPGLTATDIHDVHVPGSDHVGFEVTVAPARR